MKSSFRNMVLSLSGLTIFVGAMLGGVNLLTAKPIEEASRKARIDAMAAILPLFNNDIYADAISDDKGIILYPASLDGKDVGAAVETFSNNGFAGRFSLIVGFDVNGIITGYKVLEHSETPGLGARMVEWFCTEGSTHYIPGTCHPLAVSADGGDIDAITGATITSRAFLEAVNIARTAFNNKYHISPTDESSKCNI